MKKSTSAKSAAPNGANGDSSNGTSERKDFLIVGIGASAGGIQALKEFFENVSADSGVAYVVILHLSPNHESHLAEVLQTTAPIPVTQVNERVKVEPNHVYVVPPSQHLGMEDGHIVVEPNLTLEARRAPVDIFFRTLAESRHAGAIAVVLSGSGADGSMGLKRVKERGGAVFVQNPREAEFSEMPRNSIETDLVDAVLNVAEIPAKIIAYKTNLGTVEIQDSPESRPEKDQSALREIFALLRVRTGHDFTNYKHPTVLRRIERRINVHELRTLTDYADFLGDNPNETVALLKDLLISVTNFFRDKEAFEFLETDVVPRILQGKSNKDEVRVWIAGCATGEEAYSLAMLFAEQLEGNQDAPAIQIFATDIDEAAISHSRAGFYTLVDVADISAERLHRFFITDGNGFRVRRELRETVLFAKHNLLKDAPFSRLDLVTCRNLLIYFNHMAQERAMETFHFALNPGAFLFLGASESTNGAGDLYANVSKEHRIYQSRQASAKTSYPVPNVLPTIRYAEQKIAAPTVQEQTSRLLERISFSDLHQQMLEQYAPPSIVVNENHDIVHLSDRAGRFLQFAGGEPSKNLLHLIRSELRLELRTALFQAVQRQANVVGAAVKVQTDEREETINVQVRPVLRAGDTARGFLLILFEPAQIEAVENEAEKIIATDEPIIRQLEEELEKTKAELRFSVEQFETQTEELRASNEELQAINEELRSTAEELETSREELQSVNEELITVNDELKFKIEELSQTNNDFQNLLNSTDIGTIFLDRRLRVKMFTPTAREVFNLIDADLNRPLADITTKINYADLHRDVARVLETPQTVEREFENGQGKWVLMRVYPYRTTGDHISGAVVTFIDITNRIESEEALRKIARNREHQVAVFDTALSAIADFAYTFDRNGRFTYANKPLLDLLGITLQKITGKTFRELPYPPDLADKMHAQILQVVETGEIIKDETSYTSPAGDEGFYEYIFAPVKGKDGTVEIVAGSTRVITERKRAEEALRLGGAQLQVLLDEMPMGAYLIDADFRISAVNPTALPVFGKIPDLIGRDFDEVIHRLWSKEYADEIVRLFSHTLETGEPYYTPERIEERLDLGVTEYYEWNINRIPLPDGRNGVVCYFRDVSAQVLARLEIAASEEKHRTLFESIDEGVSTIEVLFDEQNKAVDYRFLETNPAFERQTGLENAVGKRMRELAPEHEEFWFETYGQIAKSGEARRFEGEAAALGRIYDVYAFRVGAPGENRVAILFNDIGERKRAEDALRQSEGRLRALVENLPGGAVFVIDKNLRYLVAEGEALTNAGFAPHAFIGRTINEALPPELAADYESFYRKALAGEAFEHEHEAHDRTFISRGVPLKNANDDIYAVLAISYDITERKRAEQSLHESEIRYRAIVGQSTAGITELDLNSFHALVNPGYCQMLGYTEAELMKMSLRDVTHPDDYPHCHDIFENCIKTGTSHVNEKRIVCKDGSAVWITDSISLITDASGKPLRVATIAIDINKRKQIEKALSESEERLRLLIESASDYAIITITQDNLVESWNTGAENTFGWKENEIVGKSCAILFTPEDRERGVPAMEIQCAAETGKAEDERWHIRKDGSRFYASGVMQPIGNGGIDGFVKICRDQTEKIEAEKTVQDKQILQRLIAAQEDERKRIARDLHDELGQQLTALRLKLEATRKICEEGEISGKIDEMQLITRQLDADVDFLAWELRPAALDDLGLVISLENYVREWARHAGVTAEFHAPKAKRLRLAPEVETNLYRIAQEALNNTHKHAEAGRVSVVLEKRDDLIVLIVEDDGKGFKPKDKKNRSKGLGLMGMRERAALVHGTLEIESAPQRGTTVYVRVPAVPFKKEKDNA